jgi:hypothetical protein
MKPDWGYYGTYDESAHADLWDGVVGYWAPCLGPTGTRLHDLSRWNNWGTLTNMDPPTDWVIDGGQYALDFDGVNDFVSTTADGQKAQNLTVSFWCYHRTQNKSLVSIIDNDHSGGEIGGWVVQSEQAISTRAYYFTYRAASGFLATGSTLVIPLNTWSLITYTKSGTLVRGFRDGQQIYSTTVADAVIIYKAVTKIGIGDCVSVPFRQFNGLLDDVIIWNRGLSPNEVQRLYQLGRGGMLERRRRRRVYAEQAGFRGHYRSQRAQLIGGGLR